MSAVTDEILYRRYLSGDVSALDDLLVRHKNGLTFFLLSFVKNEMDAEDLMMETFAVLLSGEAAFGYESSFKTWLYGIGRNLARNHVRKEKGWLFGGDAGKRADVSGNEPEMQWLQKEENRELYRAMQRLREEYRTALFLQYMEGMSVAETASIMKKSEKQIYNITARAKKKLRGMIGGPGDGIILSV